MLGFRVNMLPKSNKLPERYHKVLVYLMGDGIFELSHVGLDGCVHLNHNRGCRGVGAHG